MPHSTLDKSNGTVSKMFDQISPRYDLLNRFMTFGIVDYWYKRLAEAVRPSRPKEVVDIATGTASFAIKMLQRIPSIRHITGVDISTKMLAIADERISQLGYQNEISLLKGEVSNLPFVAEAFDTATCSLGIRNFPNLSKAFAEIYRILKPEGTLFLLELSQPPRGLIRSLHRLYIHTVLPLMGKQLAKNRRAYKYLYQSIEAMPRYDELTTLLYRTGYREVSYTPLTGGIATLFTASK